jgi:hypothetical protein
VSDRTEPVPETQEIQMSTTTVHAPAATTIAPAGHRLTWRAGLATGAVAAVVTTVVAVAMRAAGVPLEVGGEPIPAAGFGQMVLLGALIGIPMARRLSRTTFYRAAVVLTALSCVPSIALGTGVASQAGLVVTHLVAAAIIVPRFAPRQH